MKASVTQALKAPMVAPVLIPSLMHTLQLNPIPMLPLQTPTSFLQVTMISMLVLSLLPPLAIAPSALAIKLVMVQAMVLATVQAMVPAMVQASLQAMAPATVLVTAPATVLVMALVTALAMVLATDPATTLATVLSILPKDLPILVALVMPARPTKVATLLAHHTKVTTVRTLIHTKTATHLLSHLTRVAILLPKLLVSIATLPSSPLIRVVTQVAIPLSLHTTKVTPVRTLILTRAAILKPNLSTSILATMVVLATMVAQATTANRIPMEVLSITRRGLNIITHMRVSPI